MSKWFNHRFFGFMIVGIILFSYTTVCARAEPDSAIEDEESEFLRGWNKGWDRGFKLGWDARGSCCPNIDEASRSGLKGLKKIEILISHNGGEDYSNSIKNHVESRLRAIGIEIVDAGASDVDAAVLHIRFNTNTAALRLNLSLHQFVLVPRSIEEDKKIFYVVAANTWKNCEMIKVDTGNTIDPKRKVREFIDESMDQFVNEWLKENQKLTK